VLGSLPDSERSGVDPIVPHVATAHGDQIVVYISPFATAGPYSTWRSTDLVDAAIAGHLRLSGDPDREPLLLDAAQLMADPQLAALDFFVELDHADAGVHPWPRFPARLSKTPATLRRHAALMGEHNRYAVCELAGRSEAEYDALVASGIVRVDPPA